MNKHIKIGTRGSQLALWQANWVAGQIEKIGLQTQIVTIETTGDKNLSKTIAKIGGKGVFTDELEHQLRQKTIDIAVHSAKDLPSDMDEDLELIAFSKREMVNDVLISFNKYFAIDASQRIVLGTSSTRRVAMIKHYMPKTKIVDMRGNLQTRMRKLEDGLCDALVLAYAGVHRMGYDKHIVKHLATETFTPAVGQGALAIQCSKKINPALKKFIRAALNDPDTEIRLLAERSFLHSLEGGCSVPIFALADIEEQQLTIQGGVISLNGKKIIREQASGSLENPIALGQQLAQKVIEQGGKDILKEIKAKNSSK